MHVIEFHKMSTYIVILITLRALQPLCHIHQNHHRVSFVETLKCSPDFHNVGLVLDFAENLVWNRFANQFLDHSFFIVPVVLWCDSIDVASINVSLNNAGIGEMCRPSVSVKNPSNMVAVGDPVVAVWCQFGDSSLVVAHDERSGKKVCQINKNVHELIACKNVFNLQLQGP